MFIRKAVVAGAFYPSDIRELESYLNTVIKRNKNRIKPKAIMVPHAGYVYSGHIAAKAYSIIESFDTYIILGPNHTGMGEEISVFEGIYEMPFGNIETDNELIHNIINSSEAQTDYYAHFQEHSIEVQLPFINHISDKPYKIVPIVIGTHNKEKLKTLGVAIAKAVNASAKNILMVVSSDMNHYENQSITLQKDELAIEKIESLDENGLFDVVEHNNISMCGVACCYSAIIASKLLGAKRATLIDHQTSGDINKDYTQVVGYASIVIE